MITVKNISKSFGDKLVLDDISLSFRRGMTNLVIGESGSGKTVLMKICTGLVEPDAGEVLFNDIRFPIGLKILEWTYEKIWAYCFKAEHCSIP